jgi:hypothetical protein
MLLCLSRPSLTRIFRALVSLGSVLFNRSARFHANLHRETRVDGDDNPFTRMWHGHSGSQGLRWSEFPLVLSLSVGFRTTSAELVPLWRFATSCSAPVGRSESGLGEVDPPLLLLSMRRFSLRPRSVSLQIDHPTSPQMFNHLNLKLYIAGPNQSAIRIPRPPCLM